MNNEKQNKDQDEDKRKLISSQISSQEYNEAKNNDIHDNTYLLVHIIKRVD